MLSRALNRRLEPWFRVAVVLLLNIPLIALPLAMNLRGAEPGPVVFLYVAGIILGYYVLLLLVVLTVLSIALLFTPRVLFLLSGLVLTLFNFYLFVDYRVYAICRFHIDPFWMNYVFRDLTGIGLTASSLAYGGFILIGLTVLEFFLFRLARRIRLRRWVLPALASVCLVALATGQIIHVVAFERDIGRITSLTPHFPFYMPVTSHREAVKYGHLLPIELAEGDADSGGGPAASLRYPLQECTAPSVTRPLNVIYLILESWRYDAMSEDISPNIYALSKKGSLFRKHFSSGNATTPGVFGLFYGIHPTYWMAVKSNNATLHNPLLIDLLEQANYSFGIYADSHFERHKIKDTMFRDIPVHETFTGSNRSEKEVDMNNQMISFVREQHEQDRPFMLFGFYKASHYHYVYPDSYRVFTPVKDFSPEMTVRRTERAAYLNDYRNAVYYDDVLIGELLAELEALGLMDETIIIVTTDHGEEFDDDGAGYWGHTSNFTQYQTHVPLVFYYPGKAPRVIDTPTAHVDIPTTLIQEIFGIRNVPADFSNGCNLFSEPIPDRALVVSSNFNHAFVIGDNVYVVFPLYTRGYRLEDIKIEAPAPRSDLIRAVMEEMGRFYTLKDRNAPSSS